MKNYFTNISLILLIGTALTFLGCTKEKYSYENFALGDLNWDPTLAAPLINSHLSLEDFLTDSSVFLNHDTTDQSLIVIYRSDAISQVAEDIFNVPDQTSNFGLSLPIPPVLLPGDSLTVPLTIQESFMLPSGDILDSLAFKAGIYEIAISGDLNHDAKIKVSSNNIFLNGMPFETTLDYIYNGSLPVTVSSLTSLGDFEFKYDNTGIDTNLITIDVEVTTYISNNPINASPYTLSLLNEFRDLEFVSLFGELNTQNVSLQEDTIEINMFNSNIQGSFNLDDPRVKITFGNSFGLPVSIDLSSFSAYSSINPPHVVTLAGPGIPSPFILNAPNPQLIGQTVNTVLDLNKGNSNIDNFFNLPPEYIVHQINAELNPYGAGIKTFILDTSKLDVQMDIEVPLAGSISNFVLQDTLDFELDYIDEIDLVETVEFRTGVDNGFPIDIAIQAYFVDSLGNILDSLMNSMETIVAAAPAGPAPDYKSTTTTYKRTNILFPRSRIDALFEAKKIIIKGKLVTSNNGESTIKVYSDYFIDFKLGVKTELNASL